MAAVGDEIKELYGELLGSLGKDGIAAQYPRDFEVYVLAMELVTGFEGNTVDYMMFPVNPSNIQKTELERTNIVKTFGGTTVINSSSFVPKDLSISGNFGRNFKYIGNNNSTNPNSIDSGVYTAEQIDNKGITKPAFSRYVKTGYGLIKTLQSIINKAKGFESNGEPFKLLVYNPALGENYLCALTKNPLTLKQDESGSNMVWGYTLNLKIIGDLDNMFIGERSTQTLSEKSAIQKLVNNTGKAILSYI